MKKVQSRPCSMCDMEEETLTHMTIHCKYSTDYTGILNKDAVAGYHFLSLERTFYIYDGFLNRLFTDGGGKLLLTQVGSPRYLI